MLIKKSPQNQAGIMGRYSSQPGMMKNIETIDPLEKVNQAMAGRTQGGSMEGILNNRKSIMSRYGKK